MLDREDLISPRRMRRFFDRYYMAGPREEEEWRYWGECLSPPCWRLFNDGQRVSWAMLVRLLTLRIRCLQK